MLAALRRAQEIGQVRIGADLEQVVSAMIGTFYADHLAGRDVDDGWSTRVVQACSTVWRVRRTRAVNDSADPLRRTDTGSRRGFFASRTLSALSG
jgi:hypothetical protein